jgi:hypothetical protein
LFVFQLWSTGALLHEPFLQPFCMLGIFKIGSFDEAWPGFELELWSSWSLPLK